MFTFRKFITTLLRQRSKGPEEQAYLRAAGEGFMPDAIIDVGAYQGEWTRMARRVFRDVPTTMVEAQTSKRSYLEKVCADLPNVRYASTVLSAHAGETVTFYEMETGSSFLPEQSNAERQATQMTTGTLDDVAADLPGRSLFLKVDVQGAELHVLDGGPKTLARARVVQLETALMEYNKGAPPALQVLSYMEERGFSPFDISGFSRVKGHLVQVDFLFAKHDDIALRPNFINF